jgi:citrate synthase
MIEYIPGLEKIPAAESSISFIDGQVGILEYRGIRIEELAANCTFDEVSFLLLDGQLPTQTELDSFTEQSRAERCLSTYMKDLISCLPAEAHPMAKLQTCVAAMGMFMGPHGVFNDATRRDWAVRFIGKFPSLIAAIDRKRRGLDIIEPDLSLGRSSDFLRMLTGEAPDALSARVLNKCLILHADHTMNASTFATRVVASTESEPGAAISAAVGSLAGPLHGGANERVIAMLEEIGSVDKVRPFFETRMANHEKIMGLGHRVYKTKDPRAIILQEMSTELFEDRGASPLYDLAVELERIATIELGSKGIYPNVDFYSGIVYTQLGIPTDLFTPIFALARISGWMAHWLEQMRSNRIFRPTQKYTGVHGVHFVPIEDRGGVSAT